MSKSYLKWRPSNKCLHVDRHTILRRARGGRFSFYWSVTGSCGKYYSKYLMLVNWKLACVVLGVYYILTPICRFCWSIVLQHACYWSVTTFFLEKILNRFIYASPNSNKIKFDWQCVIGHGKRKKHAKNLGDLFWNLWAVSRLVNLPQKATIWTGRQKYKEMHIIWNGSG